MKAVIQRVKRASVKADGVLTGEIEQGFAVLLGVEKGDDDKDAEILADKIWGLRVFTDENDKMNLSLEAVGGQVLVVSNFTLCADCSHGRRPNFFGAAPPDEADRLYEHFIFCLKNAGVSKLACGVFGADMELEITNDGPVTIILDSRELKK
ncbi:MULTISPECIES: D-aminoacyl-tRNA deacylase [unclassified Ruminococcus]|uniref:D-aminoacyl-tRNA deacylase n=1 Tax=unclassified Ruminococcus TaxID=2608920 RepID=UPI002109D0B3|nr:MULTISPECIES: D-aminoacyl-tRNA deacylase [unclassified Ruminococcus]MCQ4022265.1 D-tyrosyl-tRNA(Tyr) deacylase [Ruminococcus sp. zg-924]MCQ4114593.1 D-tyrosyl-tRNA(Tyr) deacylase [Ruminococcus sp. zg-921]